MHARTDAPYAAYVQHPDRGYVDPHLPYYDMDGMPISIGRWAQLFEDIEGRRIAETLVPMPGGSEARVSTVWLGIDHNFAGEGPPLIFETMAFFDNEVYNDSFCARTSTREEAERMHEIGCKWAASLGLLPAEHSAEESD